MKIKLIQVRVNNEEDQALINLAKDIARQKYMSLTGYIKLALKEKLAREK